MNVITTKGTFDNKTPDGKVIRKAQIARQLLHKGQQIIDIKGDKSDPDGKRSVFVFLNNDEFQKAFAEVMDENNKKRSETSEVDELKKQIAEMSKKITELTDAKE